MTFRPLIIAGMLGLPLAALADEPADGERIFKSKCQACHALPQVQGLLMPKPPAERPAHLTRFLKGHPAILNEDEKKAVIILLSRPEQ
jgi:cytochrome c5